MFVALDPVFISTRVALFSFQTADAHVQMSLSSTLLVYARAHDSRASFRSIVLESHEWVPAAAAAADAPHTGTNAHTIVWRRGPHGPASSLLQRPKVASDAFFEAPVSSGDGAPHDNVRETAIHSFASIRTVHLTVIPRTSTHGTTDAGRR